MERKALFIGEDNIWKNIYLKGSEFKTMLRVNEENKRSVILKVQATDSKTITCFCLPLICGKPFTFVSKHTR